MRKERVETGERYGQTVKNELVRRAPELSPILDAVATLFDQFVALQPEEGLKAKTELETLFLVKNFLRQNRKIVQTVTDRSMLENFDCVTQSVIACLLAERAGFETSVGRPKELARHFHAFVVRGNGSIFEMAGQRRKYQMIVMRPEEAVSRLALVYRAYQLAGVRARKRRDEERHSAKNNKD
jgi:hypothetical protein